MMNALPGGIAGGQPQQNMQGQQGPQPGVAQPLMSQGSGGGGTPQGVPSLSASFDQLPLPQLLTEFNNPNSSAPRYALLAAINEKAKQMRAAQAVQGQLAMGQAAQQRMQPPVAQEVVGDAMQMAALDRGIGAHPYGYAGGGIVAFSGGGESKFKQTFGYAPLYEEGQKYGIILSPYDSDEARAAKIERIKQFRENEQANASGIPTALGPNLRKVPAGGRTTMANDPRLSPQYLSDVAASFAPPAPPPGTRSGTASTKPSAAPASGPITPMGPPAVTDADRMAMLEPDYERQSKAIQELYQKQGQVDPELMRLRQAAYKSSEDIARRRDADRKAALEAAQAQLTAPLMGNQEALLRMAGAMGGAKRLGEGLSAIAGAAGEVRGEQRKAFEAAQKVSREEQIAIDALNQALAEKRVADRSGDVTMMRQADLNVEQAKMNLLDKRFGIRKEVASEADKAAQRETQRRLAGAAEETARAHTMTAKAAMANAQNKGQITPYQMGQLRDKAIDNLKDRLPGLIAKARLEATKQGIAFDEQAFREALIKREIATLMGQEVSSNAPGASPGAVGQAKVLNWNDISAPKS